MEHLDWDKEKQRLDETLALAGKQWEETRQKNEASRELILASKQEVCDNTNHVMSDLWSNDGFEALVELSQEVDVITGDITRFEDTRKRLRQLEGVLRTPYFARIDFCFDGEKDYEQIYIGRSTLMDTDSYEMVVYDWRSAIAGLFYRFMRGRAFYDAPGGRISGEIGLKRQYEINGGTMEYFFDADVQITDEILRKLLSQNASSQMKAIVETIQQDQDTVIRDLENDLLMVQGVAGSGKTSIALHRAAYFMYEGLAARLAANQIMILSPNSLFERYIAEVLPELGEDSVVSAVFDDLFLETLKRKHMQTRNRFLDELLTNTKRRGRMKAAMEWKTSLSFLEILERFVEDIPKCWIEFLDITYDGRCILSKEEQRERVLAGRKETPLGLRLEQLRDIGFERLRDARRSSKSRPDDRGAKKELLRSTELDVEALYRRLFADEGYLRALAEGIVLPEDAGELIAFTRGSLNAGQLRYDDAIALFYLCIRITELNRYKNIRQVVIDEAQDYYPLQYEIFRRLFPLAKFTVVGDIHQTLEKRADISLYEQVRQILQKKKSTLVVLDKSFRCTKQILDYSAQFLEGETQIQSFNREGDVPEVYRSGSRTDRAEQIVAEIEKCREKGYTSIGLLCKNERNAVSVYDRIKDRVDVRMIRSGADTELQGVFVIPVYMAKGLEFDAVSVCDADASNYSDKDDRNLLYVACTRALHRLSVFTNLESRR